jgi:hypothetical protein
LSTIQTKHSEANVNTTRLEEVAEAQRGPRHENKAIAIDVEQQPLSESAAQLLVGGDIVVVVVVAVVVVSEAVSVLQSEEGVMDVEVFMLLMLSRF